MENTTEGSRAPLAAPSPEAAANGTASLSAGTPRFSQSWKIAGVLFVALVVGAVVFTGTFSHRGERREALVEQYTLVPEKVSQSAPITVILPEGVPFANFDPAQSLAFTPEIKGKWEAATAGSEGTYRFVPDVKLTLGAYHLVTLQTPELKMEKMFSVDEDPSVLAIFPKQEAQVNEYSSITVMFSRPMVPLSTLSENAENIPAVEITPKTEGRWKWITTRTLQFIPAKRLLRSSTYTVTVKNELRSLEGLSVPQFTHTFTTHTLDYLSRSSDFGQPITLRHDEPLRIYFNQPIDLERTRPLVALTAPVGVLTQSFVASYGTRVVVDEKTGKKKTLSDRSVLEVYPEKDMHGRVYLWNFGESYTVTLSGAVPLEGDVTLTLPLTKSFGVAPILEQVTAQSEQSDLVTPQLFDPTGTLTLHMGEAIDLSASDIEGKGIATTAYGKKCEEPEAGEEVYIDPRTCRKVDDHERIVLTFDAAKFAKGETSVVTMKKLVNEEGLTLNTAPIEESFTTFPEFRIVDTLPALGSAKGSLSDLKLCSNTPLAQPADDDFYKKVRANMMIGLWNWYRSYLVLPSVYGADERCPVGTYQTTIRYGLVPKFAYELTLDLTDHFGQSQTKNLRFTTADADPLAKGIAHLQPSVLMTPPERTSLAYGLDFINEVDLTICKVTAETMLSYRTFTPKTNDDPSTLSCVERKTAHLTLPKSYATRKYLEVNLKTYYPEAKGHYVVVLSNPDYRRVSRYWDSTTQKQKLALEEQLFEKTYITVTSLAVGAKQVERGDYYYGRGEAVPRESFMRGKWPSNLYWVTDFKNLSPVFGAVVTPYISSDKSVLKLPSGQTDLEGIAKLPSADNVVGAVVTTAGESAIVSSQTDSLSWARPAGPARREYIYTDRPIYRPGDTVHVKGISRIGYDASFEIPTGDTTVEVRDAKYDIARTETVKMNKNGTFEFSFTLDPKAPLGYYPISTKTGGYGSFQVEEYVAPQFKVVVSPDKEEYVSGDTATLHVAADYYFGVPVAKGEAEYRVVAQEYYFDRYRDRYFSFGGGWYDNEGGWYGDRFLTSGKVVLDAAGKGTISEKLSIDELFSGSYKNQSKVVSVFVTVKNENGQSVSKEHSFILHRGTFYAGVVMDDYFVEEGKSATARLKTVDIEGKPLRKGNLALTLAKVEWKSYKRQEVDGNFYYRTERVKAEVQKVEVDTDRNGDGSYEFTAGDSGEYELTVSGKDERDNVVSAAYSFYVSGRRAVAIKPTNNETLELVAEKTELAVGDTASFVIKSPYPRAKALVSVARGDTYEYKVIPVDAQLTKYSFIVTEKHIPNVVASALLLSPDPEIKYGEVHYTVGTKEKELAITVTPEKSRYLPGEEVALHVEAKDSNGRPVQAELSLAVVDMSVLALVGNPKKNPVAFFYNGEPLTIKTAINVKNVLDEAEIPVGTKGGSGGGGDDLEKKKRGVFRDTAYWQGSVETDANGVAEVRFTLPDNLTEWQAESVGVTRDTKVGAGYSTFTARKSIMALPLKPRFILPGDSFAVGGTIFNESDEKQKLKVTVEAPTLRLTGEHETTVTIEPHTSLSVSFPAVAPEGVVSGKHEFTLSAKNDAYEDVVSSSFPIERNDTYEFTVTAGRITASDWKEQLYLPKNVVPDRGALTISLAATMASVLDDAIRAMIIYPYECSEQVASKLRTIALVKEHATLFGIAEKLFAEKVLIGNREYTIDEIVTNGLTKLYQSQSPDGGMPYYMNLEPDFRLSVTTLETYVALKRAGYTVDEAKLTQSAKYVFNYINYPRYDRQLSNEDIIVGAYALTKLGNRGAWESNATRQKLLTTAGDVPLVRNQLSSTALAYLAILSVHEGFDIATMNRLFAEFENRSQVDARGTVVASNKGASSYFVENALTNTALALKAFAEAKRDSPLLEGYLRTLKTGKAKDGGFASTLNSITVIDAVTEYLKWKKEADARLSVAVTLDAAPLLTAEFAKKNITEVYMTEVPMSDIKKGVVQTVSFLKKNLGTANDAFYYDIALRYYLPADAIAPRDEGMSIRREFYRTDDTEFAHPVTEATQGEVLLGRVVIQTPKTRFHVTLEDFIPAGVEVVNQRLATEDQSLGAGEGDEYMPERGYGGYGAMGDGGSWLSRNLAAIFSGKSAAGPKKDVDGAVEDEMYGNRSTRVRPLYPSAVEAHDDRIFAYVGRLEQGEYVYEYYVRALIPGTYQHHPAVASELYTPENFGRTGGALFTVKKK